MNTKDELRCFASLSKLFSLLSCIAIEKLDGNLNDIKVRIDDSEIFAEKNTNLQGVVNKLDSLLENIWPKLSNEDYVLIEHYKLHSKDREIEALKAKIAIFEAQLENN